MMCNIFYEKSLDFFGAQCARIQQASQPDPEAKKMDQTVGSQDSFSTKVIPP